MRKGRRVISLVFIKFWLDVIILSWRGRSEVPGEFFSHTKTGASVSPATNNPTKVQLPDSSEVFWAHFWQVISVLRLKLYHGGRALRSVNLLWPGWDLNVIFRQTQAHREQSAVLVFEAQLCDKITFKQRRDWRCFSITNYPSLFCPNPRQAGIDVSVRADHSNTQLSAFTYVCTRARKDGRAGVRGEVEALLLPSLKITQVFSF